ncbi:hypothetical protein E1287_33105 [Actinomadura sp. KC06]|uniref:DUF6882 domain-containing protein n=1 Tax=Actinomadura sp. KC06 TaxID=2530369 RepID=UPI001049DEAD|nr:DUF6882 domain-containing protein [Actinomadura sp. KC06]TDD28231.1 hypothetical protein E1287_33105 [Actinomadura sp. KC06]
METFSDALLNLACPHLGWVVEQLEAFYSVLPPGEVGYDAAVGTARFGDLELRADLLGTYAEDGTFQWGWAKQPPAITAPVRLREIGQRHMVPELTDAMVDLTRFPDPRLAAKHLGVIAMGLLGSRGAADFSHGGRSLTFLVTDDPRIPAARPDPAGLAEALQTGAQMLPEANVEEVISGYAAHHRLAARPVSAGLELDLPGRHQALVRVEHGRLSKIVVTGPDGPVIPAPRRLTPVTDPAAATFVPAGLFAELARHAAAALDRGAVALGDHLKGLGWDPQALPVWEPGVVRYGDVLTARAREIGIYRPGTGTWHWSDSEWDGVARVRSAAREYGADALAADQVVLPDSEVQIFIAVFLARSAVHLGRARGLVRIPTAEGDHRFVAVIDPRVPEPSSELDIICDVIVSAANFLQELTPHQDRYATMRAMVVDYFEAYGIAPIYVGEPQMLIGLRGLNEVRVAFSHDGTINHATWGMHGALG